MPFTVGSPTFLDVSTPAANTAAVVTYPPLGPGNYHVIQQIVASYNGTPSGGNLTITDGVITLPVVDLTQSGPFVLNWQTPERFTPGLPLTLTLAAGGVGVAGKLNVIHWAECNGTPCLIWMVDFRNHWFSGYLPLL
jgi:hypothetical protein